MSEYFSVVPIGAIGWAWIGVALVGYLLAWLVVGTVVGRSTRET